MIIFRYKGMILVVTFVFCSIQEVSIGVDGNVHVIKLFLDYCKKQSLLAIRFMVRLRCAKNFVPSPCDCKDSRNSWRLAGVAALARISLDLQPYRN